MKKAFFYSLLAAAVIVGCKKDDDAIGTAKINSIKLTSWPSNDSTGTPWDSASSPDIYFDLLDAQRVELSNQPFDDTTFTDATGTVERRVDDIPFRLASPDADYYIEVMDDDSIDSDDSMGSLKFNLSNYSNRPTSIILTNNTVGVSVQIGLIWE